MADKMLNTDWSSNCSVLPDLPNPEQQLIGAPNGSKQITDNEGKRNCVATYRSQNVFDSDGPFGKQLVLRIHELEYQQRPWDAEKIPEDVVDLVLTHETDCLGRDEGRYIIEDLCIDLGKGKFSHLGDRKQDTSNPKTFSEVSAFKTFSEYENVNKAYEGIMFPAVSQTAVEEPLQEDVSLHTSATVSLSRDYTVAMEPEVDSKGFNSVPKSFAVEEIADFTTEQVCDTHEKTNEVLNIYPVMTVDNPAGTQTSSSEPGDPNRSVTRKRPLQGDNSDIGLLSTTFQEGTANLPGKPLDRSYLQESTFDKSPHSLSSQFMENIFSKTHGNHMAEKRSKPRCRYLDAEECLVQTETNPMHETKVNSSFHAPKIHLYQARGNFEFQTVRNYLITPVRHPKIQNVGDSLFQVRGKQKQNTAVSFPTESAVFSLYQPVAKYGSRIADDPTFKTATPSSRKTAGKRVSHSTNKFFPQFAGFAVRDPLSQIADKLMSESTGNIPVYKAETSQFQAARELEIQTIGNLSTQTAGYPLPHDVRNPLLQVTSELLLETSGNSTFQTAESPVPQKTEGHMPQMEVDPQSPAQHKKLQNMQLPTTEYFQFQTSLTPHSQTHCNVSTVPGSPMSVCSDVSMSSSKSRFPSTTLWPDQPDKPPCSENVKQALVTKIQKNRNGLDQRYQPYPERESGYQSSLPNLHAFKGLFLQ